MGFVVNTTRLLHRYPFTMELNGCGKAIKDNQDVFLLHLQLQKRRIFYLLKCFSYPLSSNRVIFDARIYIEHKDGQENHSPYQFSLLYGLLDTSGR